MAPNIQVQPAKAGGTGFLSAKIAADDWQAAAGKSHAFCRRQRS
jgi:hypothetical protein